MANKYSKLLIDKDKLPNWIELWCEENLNGESLVSSKELQNRIQFVIKNESNTIKIDFQKCNGGLMTICPNVGTNIDISKRIAESIYNRVSSGFVDSPFAHGFSIMLSSSDFETLIDLISVLDGVRLINTSEQLEEGKQQYKLYRFAGAHDDKITIKYYPKTSRMQLQGKPLFLFNEVVSIVSENGVPQDDVVDASLKFCSLDMSKDEVHEEMRVLLGSDLYDFLSNSQRTILSTSFILHKVDGYLGDFSILVQPANRVYEGFVKKIFAQFGLTCSTEQQLGSFFKWEDEITPTMKPEYSCLLGEDAEYAFSQMFKFYTKHRHPYMHSTAYDYSTTIIENRKDAEEIFNEIMISMKSWFEWFVTNKK